MPPTQAPGSFKKQLLATGLATLIAGCSLFATRPVQTMSDTAAALRAAREVQADTLAPELYRQAGEWFFKAKREYKFKNFDRAREYANKARLLAEDAEFEAIRNGGTRGSPTDAALSDPMATGIQAPYAPTPTPTSEPYEYPTPTGTPADAFPTGGAPSPGP